MVIPLADFVSLCVTNPGCLYNVPAAIRKHKRVRINNNNYFCFVGYKVWRELCVSWISTPTRVLSYGWISSWGKQTHCKNCIFNLRWEWCKVIIGLIYFLFSPNVGDTNTEYPSRHIMVKWRRNNVISTLIALEQRCFDVVWPWCAHWVVVMLSL